MPILGINFVRSCFKILLSCLVYFNYNAKLKDDYWQCMLKASVPLVMVAPHMLNRYLLEVWILQKAVRNNLVACLQAHCCVTTGKSKNLSAVSKPALVLRFHSVSF